MFNRVVPESSNRRRYLVDSPTEDTRFDIVWHCVACFTSVSDLQSRPIRRSDENAKWLSCYDPVDMRFLAKLHALAALAVVCILYSAWSLNSYYRSKQHNPQQFHYRLVSFGDSWSDTDPTRNPHHGKLWTEHLCGQVCQKPVPCYGSRTPEVTARVAQLTCLFTNFLLKFSCLQDNLAESADPSRRLTLGAIVDNSELESFDDPTWSKPPADLSTQISRWVEKEKAAVKDLGPDQQYSRADHTLFSVSLGIWDLWRILAHDVEDPKAVIQRSVQKLFDNLNDLASRATSNGIKVILLAPVDVTFLPGYGSRGEGTHKDAIDLFDEWNGRLRNQTAKWERGTIFLVDTNAFLIEQIRERHLWVAGYIETEDYGKDPGMAWEDVAEPCVGHKNNVTLGHGQACEVPEKILFW